MCKACTQAEIDNADTEAAKETYLMLTVDKLTEVLMIAVTTGLISMKAAITLISLFASPAELLVIANAHLAEIEEMGGNG